jgi:flagellar biosynthesis protein FlhB
MADGPDRDQQTEAATAKRKADAEKEGDILQSREFSTALVMLAGFMWLILAGPWFVEQCVALLRDGLSISAQDMRTFDPSTQVFRLGGVIMLPLLSLFGVAMLASVGGSALLGSFGFRANAMAFKASRINPAAGLGRMFGTHGLVELGKSLAKAAVLTVMGLWLLSHILDATLGLGRADTQAAASTMGSSIVFAVKLLGLGLFIIAGIDVPIQFIRRNARLRMSKQQIKEELRQSEGAPELKAHLRQRQHDVLMGSARKAMSEATVVLVNPTHFSIALRYRPGIDAAPVVVARGRGETALAIRTLATENAVPILEYPQLTRAIYFTSRAGQTIAEDLYLAVATILSFVFNIERALAEGIAQPAIIVPGEKQFDENGKAASA